LFIINAVYGLEEQNIYKVWFVHSLHHIDLEYGNYSDFGVPLDI